MQILIQFYSMHLSPTLCGEAGCFLLQNCKGKKIEKLILSKTQGKAIWVSQMVPKVSLGPSRKVKNVNVPLVCVNTWT